MSKINFSNTKFLSLILLGICLLAISENILLVNKIFWGITSIISILINRIDFKFKSFLLSIYAIGLLYIQFIFNQYIFSEEFFINCIGVLLIVKYAELNNKNNLLSYNLICMVLSVVSLISGQDIFSSLISLSIIVLLVINMYLIQQKEVMDFNFKNILKYLGFGLSIFPFIIIFYLIFPRAEINFRLFDPSKSSLGIPDSINLGSFENFANSDEKVFTLVNKNFKKQDLYFRVKIFDYMEEDKSWRTSSPLYLYNNYKNSYKITNAKAIDIKYQVILNPHKKKWIPALNNSRLTDQNVRIGEDPFNQTYKSLDPIDRKIQIEFQKYDADYRIGEELLEYYTLLPKSVSKELIDWVKNNKQSKSNIEYLNHILNTFSDGSYYYNLSPVNNSQNSYSDFFLRGKEGYCEYFAGTLVLLSRLANIPSRIVSGYYGGELNTVGDFFNFRQQDAHAWAEVWINGKGWIQIDPTSVIPGSNIRNSYNNLFNNAEENTNSLFILKAFQNLKYFFNYADFVWTKHLLSYDNNKRKSFIKDIMNLRFSNIIYLIFAPLIIYMVLRLYFKINKSNILKWMLNYIILISKKQKKILNSDTHQEIFNKLKQDYQEKYKSFFNLYESFRYQNKNIELTKIFKTFISAK